MVYPVERTPPAVSLFALQCEECFSNLASKKLAESLNQNLGGTKRQENKTVSGYKGLLLILNLQQKRFNGECQYLAGRRDSASNVGFDHYLASNGRRDSTVEDFFWLHSKHEQQCQCSRRNDTSG